MPHAVLFVRFVAARLARTARLFATALFAASLGIALPNGAHADSAPLKVGIATSPQIDALKVAAKEAKAQGLDVKIIEFTDWNTPNAALANKDIDVNYFQHIPFLENAKKQGGYDFVAIAPGTIMKIGLYSKKVKSFGELKDGAKVAIANDPVNGGRGLLLLQRAGLITLKPGVDYRATTRDIVANPKHLKIVQLEASQLARSLDDVDLAQGYPSFIKLAGTTDPNSALLFDGTENKNFAIQWVVRPDSVNDPRIRKFIAIYQHSPAVRKALDNAFGSLYAVAW
ncbi:MetQ/NlpA family ABC transporter substrate-binding protein [Burkholderia multivorans]|jgi:D-methionine transport system substrate-binding protein|uniref:Lipoprotein n=1 Tax=Burkholderia multivorans TaxID=87883 RepID=A0A2S9MLP6_9BURK|nr:MetQ/NlpA family ABC transporter substrate-binding protein [Burkholderia multivorans]KHS15324.1 methionine ABC transporter substrate-binding protein [Burkholderia multivorans]KHS18558.1 methionine ABC transporter substrate-binding protein [Burkholderia multivorans]MBJ9615256.1 MetQ/NlpA family ABC transporter substrate-binding protein [Burkholderia multivorans]MBR7893900.1 MetQ/NlpA family ABC transporter substrate-binding protein [Burkholderia multivorans]MBR7921337.1 MetQ/NlpA family ABC 